MYFFDLIKFLGNANILVYEVQAFFGLFAVVESNFMIIEPKFIHGFIAKSECFFLYHLLLIEICNPFKFAFHSSRCCLNGVDEVVKTWISLHRSIDMRALNTLK